MAILIQNISGNVTEAISDTLISIQNVSASIYETTCNHIEAPGFEAFMFDFSTVSSTETLNSGINYGLIVNNKSRFTELNISY